MESEHKNLSDLSTKEIEGVLTRGSLAHLGCSSRAEVYVIPITYAFDGKYIYGHSLMGKKVEMMRANPQVCVQVEEIQDLFNWKSVIVHGHFEELKEGMAPLEALRLLKMKIASIEKSITPLQVEIDAILSRARIYRIKIEKMTGRAEHQGQVPN